MSDRKASTSDLLGNILRQLAPRACVWYSAVIFLALLWGCAGRDAVGLREAAPRGIERVQHVIVIYMENWSFDGQFGRFPGANGIANAGDTIRQVRMDGSPYTILP